MKKQLLCFLVCLVLTTLNFTDASASIAAAPQEMRLAVVDKMRSHPERFVRNNARSIKRLHRVAKRIERRAMKRDVQVDFNDPVDKWLWFGVFGLGIAIVLSFFTPFGLAGLIAFLAIVCLVIWVVKHEAV